MTAAAETRVHLGVSTCPNDTYAYAALLEDRVDRRGLAFDVELLDVEELNRRALAGDFDVAKVSFAAALAAGDTRGVLPLGSALGFGVGPVVLGAPGRASPARRVLAPGEHTTAALLWRLFHAGDARPEHVVFSEIVPALRRGEADLGVCIHEGRFTWREQGLELVEDLGETWEHATGAPLPLGGLVARRDLDAGVARRVHAVLADSLAAARRDPDSALPAMRRHAQEHADAVLWKHVELYVTSDTEHLGPTARAALDELARQAERAGLVPRGDAPLAVLDDRLFHLADPAACATFLAAAQRDPGARLAPPSLAAEGFVHLSYADQLAGTLAAHFAETAELVLVELDPRPSDLRVEPSRGGERFPHLYRAVAPADVLRTWPLARTGAGWTLPRLALAPGRDPDPGRAPGA